MLLAAKKKILINSILIPTHPTWTFKIHNVLLPNVILVECLLE